MRWNLLREIFSMSWHSLRMHKLRALLTIIGVIIGIMSVVGMTGLLRGLDSSMKDQLLALNSEVFFVTRFGGRIVGPREYTQLMKRDPITRDDARAIQRAIPEIDEVAVISGQGEGRGPAFEVLSYRGQETNDMVVAGVSSNYAKVYHDVLAQGRFFTEAEDRSRRRVVVLAAGPARALFGKVSALGKEVRFHNEHWKVVGVLEARKSLLGDSAGGNDFLLIPTRCHEQRYNTVNPSFRLGILPRANADRSEVMGAVIQILRNRRGLKVHEDNDFDIITQETLMDLWESLTQVIMLALTALSSVALLVGGIGVMAVMLVTVTERTAEIGVRMAVGARRRDVLSQFLIEAMALTTMGGILGILSGVLLGKLLAWGTGLPVSFPTWSYAVSLSTSVGIGLIFGVYPAQRAASLNPVEALWYRRS